MDCIITTSGKPHEFSGPTAIFRKLLTLLKLGCRDSRYIECHLVPLALNYVVSHNLDRKTHKGLHVGRFRATLGFGGIHVGDPGLE